MIMVTTDTRDIQVLDATLRDGSYQCEFGFTVEQTESICNDLERAGVRLIEVGHGAGISAGETPAFDAAAATDVEYMRAAQRGCDEADWGMFCFPVLCSVEDIQVAIDEGIDFLRVGCHVTEVDAAKSFIEAAADAGVTVSANMVKSYAVSPETFAEQTRLVESYGSDVVYIVDSAGGMVPEMVEEYASAVQASSDIPVCFHGHDNLGLGNANNLAMADAGGPIVDGTLLGYGRSGGNASTEQTAAALEKRGYDTGIDVGALLRVGQEYIAPLIDGTPYCALDTAGGYFGIHSEHFQKIRHVASEAGVDPTKLMRSLQEKNKIHAPMDLLEELATDVDPADGGSVEEYGSL